jgi:hypothetical protein
LHFRSLALQFSHEAPASPHTVSEVPFWHLPVRSQHPPQLEAPQVGALP